MDFLRYFILVSTFVNNLTTVCMSSIFILRSKSMETATSIHIPKILKTFIKNVLLHDKFGCHTTLKINQSHATIQH